MDRRWRLRSLRRRPQRKHRREWCYPWSRNRRIFYKRWADFRPCRPGHSPDVGERGFPALGAVIKGLNIQSGNAQRVEKIGDGTLALTGTNTYDATTLV